jgi:beta-1,4-N-acetylglucosaminyltransferase
MTLLIIPALSLCDE